MVEVRAQDATLVLDPGIIHRVHTYKELKYAGGVGGEVE